MLTCALLIVGVLMATASPLVGRSNGIDPRYESPLTVYHLNPASAGAIPRNMDTGDALGDLYFYLGEFLLPIECLNVSAAKVSGFDCENPERVAKDLVVTKVDMLVDTRSTTYSACNLCNGTDPITKKSCVPGEYVCDCFSRNKSIACDHSRVGAESITDFFVPHVPTSKCAAKITALCGEDLTDKKRCSACAKTHEAEMLAASCSSFDIEFFCPNPYNTCRGDNPPRFDCYRSNIPRKTGGKWYSTLAEGECTNSSGSCSWQVQSTKTVKEQCLKGRLMDTVEQHDQAGCFSACGVRNVTDTCWIGCFFDTLLGQDSAKSVTRPLAGMSVQAIERGWTTAFLPVAQGGCAAI